MSQTLVLQTPLGLEPVSLTEDHRKVWKHLTAAGMSDVAIVQEAFDALAGRYALDCVENADFSVLEEWTLSRPRQTGGRQ